MEHSPPLAKIASSALAEQIEIPGATKSGLIRPSLVVPLEEELATLPSGVLPYAPVVDAPTVRTFFAVPGGVIPPDAKSPAENSTRNRG